MPPPDLDALARRFLDLWERQAPALVTEPGLAAALAPWIAGVRQGHDDVRTDPAAAHGAPAAGASPRLCDDDLADIVRRLANCEARLNALETGARKGSEGACPSARKRGA